MAIVQPLGIFAFALGLRELVNGAELHDPSASAVGAWTLALLAAAMVFHMVRWQVDGITLGDKHAMLMDRRIVELKSSIPDLQAHEDPALQADLHALQEARFWMTWETEATIGVVFGFLQLVGMGVLMFSVEPLVLLLPVFVAPSLWFSWRSIHSDEKARRATSEDIRLAREWVRLTTTAAAGKEIRLFGMADDLLRRHSEAATRANQIRERSEHRDAAFAALGWAIFAVAYAIAIVLVVQSAVRGAIRPGDVLMIVVLGTQASTVAARGVFMLRTFGRMVNGGKRFRALEARAMNGAARGAVSRPPSTLSKGLALENLGFRYPGSDDFALRNVNLLLPAGAVVALIGENGAGKTTLVKLISGLYQPTEGRVR
ncbi:MAG: ATP-binding cassette domain-containing protein, partial [Candidatus Dormibacteraceae bacterium]